MDGATKKFIQEENEKLAIMVAKGFDQTATKVGIERLEGRIVQVEGEIVRLEEKIDVGFGKQLQETDGLRDQMRVLETRVVRLETSHT